MFVEATLGSALKYLVTGASGFLGRVICQELHSADCKLMVLGRKKNECFSTIKADIRKPFDLGTEFYDAVIHIAGNAHWTPKSKAEHQAFFDVNQLGTQHLVDALRRPDRTTPLYFVLISTVAVYGLQQANFVAETFTANPNTSYGQSKLAAENIIRDWCLDSGCIGTILRLPLVSGPNATGNLRSMIDALQAHRYLGIGDGTARRSVVRASNVAQAIPQIMRIGGTYHLTDGHHPCVKEIEAAICRVLKRRRPARLPKWLALGLGYGGDITRQMTGIRPPIDSDRVSKLTQSFTVSDDAIRQQINWTPQPIVDYIEELFCKRNAR